METYLPSSRGNQQLCSSQKTSSMNGSKPLEPHDKSLNKNALERTVPPFKTSNLFSFGLSVGFEKRMRDLIYKFEAIEATKSSTKPSRDESLPMYEQLGEVIERNDIEKLNKVILPSLLKPVNETLEESQPGDWLINAVNHQFSVKFEPIESGYQRFLDTFEGDFSCFEKFFESLLIVSTRYIPINKNWSENFDMMFYAICSCKAYLKKSLNLPKPCPKEASFSTVYFEIDRSQRDFYINLKSGQEISLNSFIKATNSKLMPSSSVLLQIKIRGIEAYPKLEDGIILPPGSAFRVDSNLKNLQTTIHLELIDPNKIPPPIDERKFSAEKKEMFFLGQEYFGQISHNEVSEQNLLEDQFSAECHGILKAEYLDQE